MAVMSTREQVILELRKALRGYWGYEEFRPLQETAMLAAMEGRDSVVVLPTGGGKSLCYQAPAVCLSGLAVVVSPLISLMKDQVDAAQACGIRAAYLNSTQLLDVRRAVLREVASGQLQLLYVAPERITQPELLSQLNRTSLAFFAIDEAHCVSTWGHDFRPHYRELRTLREQFPDAAMHAFTATATPRVREDIVAQLELRDPEIIVGQFDRPNLTYRVVRRHDTFAQIQQVLSRHPGESGIVYCITRKDVELYAGLLSSAGVRARPYHAGLDDEVRKVNQEAFIDDEIEVIVATVAFGMGDRQTGRAVRDSYRHACLD